MAHDRHLYYDIEHQREFEMLLHDPTRMPYFLDFLMDFGGHNLLMFWLEAEQFAEYTGDGRECFESAKGMVERYIGLVGHDDDPSDDEVVDDEECSSPPKLLTTLALTRQVREKLRRSVSLMPAAFSSSGTHRGSQGSNGGQWTDEETDDEIDNDGVGGRSLYAGAELGLHDWDESDEPCDEEERAVLGARWGHYKDGPRGGFAGPSAFGHLDCACSDLFGDAQAMVARQLFRDWYPRFLRSSYHRRYADFLLKQAQAVLKHPRAVTELLDHHSTPNVARQILERYLDGTHQRVGLVLRDLLGPPSEQQQRSSSTSASSSAGGHTPTTEATGFGCGPSFATSSSFSPPTASTSSSLRNALEQARAVLLKPLPPPTPTTTTQSAPWTDSTSFSATRLDDIDGHHYHGHDPAGVARSSSQKGGNCSGTSGAAGGGASSSQPRDPVLTRLEVVEKMTAELTAGLAEEGKGVGSDAVTSTTAQPSPSVPPHPAASSSASSSLEVLDNGASLLEVLESLEALYQAAARPPPPNMTMTTQEHELSGKQWVVPQRDFSVPECSVATAAGPFPLGFALSPQKPQEGATKEKGGNGGKGGKQPRGVVWTVGRGIGSAAAAAAVVAMDWCDVEKALSKVSDQKICLAFVSVRDDTASFLSAAFEEHFLLSPPPPPPPAAAAAAAAVGAEMGAEGSSPLSSGDSSSSSTNFDRRKLTRRPPLSPTQPPPPLLHNRGVMIRALSWSLTTSAAASENTTSSSSSSPSRSSCRPRMRTVPQRNSSSGGGGSCSGGEEEKLKKYKSYAQKQQQQKQQQQQQPGGAIRTRGKVGRGAGSSSGGRTSSRSTIASKTSSLGMLSSPHRSSSADAADRRRLRQASKARLKKERAAAKMAKQHRRFDVTKVMRTEGMGRSGGVKMMERENTSERFFFHFFFEGVGFQFSFCFLTESMVVFVVSSNFFSPTNNEVLVGGGRSHQGGTRLELGAWLLALAGCARTPRSGSCVCLGTTWTKCLPCAGKAEGETVSGR
jgi:hypothetical protein